MKNSSYTFNTIWKARKSLPLPVRMAAGWVKRKASPHWLWESREFKNYFDFLQKSQWWTLEELKAYQLEQLKELVKFSYENVPYYQRSFREKRIHPSDIKSLDDIQLLPLITKDEVRSHVDEFIPTGVDSAKLRVWVTGGTSGKPLKMYQDLFYSCMTEEAFSLRQRLWTDYKQYDRKATLTRDPNKRTRTCWDYNSTENEIILSSFDMTEKNMFKYVELIHKFKPRIMVGYPSALEIFARFLKRNTLSLPSLQGVFCGSEALFPGQRILIESAYNCKVFSSYGMSERVADATECEQHCGYHISMEYGILELLDKNSEPITEPGISGAVVGTGFHNNVMPLIRYQMFDIGVYSGEKCACKRNAPLVKAFKGRVREYFVGRSGKLMTLQLIWAGRHPVWSKIREMQFVQERKGEILAKIVRAPNYSDEEIIRELREEVGKILTEDEYTVDFEFVDQMALTHRGKLNFLDQKLPLDFEDIANAGF
jgi:phenylacetate-CoA ligase